MIERPLFTVGALISAGIAPTQARLFAPLLAEHAPGFGIATRHRMAAFVAQASHESAAFTRLEESLYYTNAARIRATWPRRVPTLTEAVLLVRNPVVLANRVYSDRLGNGDEASGDGWTYRGRGLFQLTGRANYMAAASALGKPYRARPELVGMPIDAVITACWYWSTHGLNDFADANDFSAITLRINGPGMMDAHLRGERYSQALEAFA
jgi:putative chitinase